VLTSRRNLRYSYGPLNDWLTRVVAPLVPRAVTPNAITLVSTAMLVPVLLTVQARWFMTAALLVVLHDMADRLDGAVARFRRDPAHDGRLGAFLDAQGDKVFHIGFLVANLAMHSVSAAYVAVAAAVIAAQSVSFVTRTLDFFYPVVGPKGAPTDLRAGGEGKLATTFCNAAAAAACVAAGSQGSAGWSSGAAVVMLLLSLDLALRSVKSKLQWRATRGEGGEAASAPDELFAIANGLVALQRSVGGRWLMRWAIAKLRLPGMAVFLGTRTALVFQLQGAAMLLCLPFLYCVKHDMPWGCLALIALFHLLMEACGELAAQHLSAKSLTYYLFNQAQFVEYASVRVFGLVCLWSQWTHIGPHWSWPEYLLVNALLVAHFVYTISLLLIRFDDTMPQHPALVASWARVGGPGVASGTNSLGVIRDRLRPTALALMTLTLGMERAGGGGSLWTQWYGGAAVLAFVALGAMNHVDLAHKLKVRGVAHKLSRTTVETLAPQDPELAVDRSANPPPYDVVVTIGCFDLFHEGHVKLMQRMRSFGTRLLVGLHDDESINLLSCVCCLFVSFDSDSYRQRFEQLDRVVVFCP
jgi:cytidyltransferase-like protein